MFIKEASFLMMCFKLNEMGTCVCSKVDIQVFPVGVDWCRNTLWLITMLILFHNLPSKTGDVEKLGHKWCKLLTGKIKDFCVCFNMSLGSP